MKKKSFLAYPYIIWSAIFIVIPLILVVLFSFTQKIDGKQVFSIENYRDKNETATILNLLSKKGLLDGIYMVVRTFPYPVDKKLGITIPKKVVCVKNTEILKNYNKFQVDMLPIFMIINHTHLLIIRKVNMILNG